MVDGLRGIGQMARETGLTVSGLELWFDENKDESKSTIDQWIMNRDPQQLAARA